MSTGGHTSCNLSGQLLAYDWTIIGQVTQKDDNSKTIDLKNLSRMDQMIHQLWGTRSHAQSHSWQVATQVAHKWARMATQEDPMETEMYTSDK